MLAFKRIHIAVFALLAPIHANASLVSEATINNDYSFAEDVDTGTSGALATTDTEVNGMTVVASAEIQTGYGFVDYVVAFEKNRKQFGTDLTGSAVVNGRFTDTITVNPVAGSFNPGDSLILQFQLELNGSGSLLSYEGTSSSFDIFNSASLGFVNEGSDVTVGSVSANGFFNTLSTGVLVGSGLTGAADGLANISDYSAGSPLQIFGEVNAFVDIDRSSSGNLVAGSMLSDYQAVYRLAAVYKDGNPLTEGSYEVVSGSGADYLSIPEPTQFVALFGVIAIVLVFRARRR